MSDEPDIILEITTSDGSITIRRYFHTGNDAYVYLNSDKHMIPKTAKIKLIYPNYLTPFELRWSVGVGDKGFRIIDKPI